MLQQVFRRMLDVIVHERRYRKVTVVVPILIPYLHPLIEPCFFRSSSKVLRQELALLVEVVVCALWLYQLNAKEAVAERNSVDWTEEKRKSTHHVNQHIQRPLIRLNQLRRVMLLPQLSVIAEIAPERLLAPRTPARVRDRRKRRHGLVLSRILQELPRHRISTLYPRLASSQLGIPDPTKVKAPWPPMLCPKTPSRAPSSSANSASSASGSSSAM